MYKRIVVGTDGSETARYAVAQATQLAALSGATLHIVSAFHTQPAVVVPEASMLALSGEARDEAQKHTQSMLDRAADIARAEGVSEVETHCVPAAPAEAPIDVSEGVDADLLVVGSVGMSGVRRFLGSVPNRVTHHAPCNVMVVRTEGE